MVDSKNGRHKVLGQKQHECVCASGTESDAHTNTLGAHLLAPSHTSIQTTFAQDFLTFHFCCSAFIFTVTYV